MINLKQFLILLVGLAISPVFGQTAIEYMETISGETKAIQKDMWDYTSTVSRGRSARKVEKKRIELINSSDAALNRALKSKDFNGDASYKEAVIEFFKILNILLNFFLF